MRILIDMDDVMDCLSDHWCEYLNERYGTSATREDMTEWDASLAFKSLTREQVEEPLGESGFWAGVKPMPGAVDGVKYIIDKGHEVYVVTNSNYKMLHEKMEEMLFKYFPFIDWEHVIIASSKQMIRGDVLIDDGYHNLLDGPYVKILFDAPWNRSVEAAKMGVYRARNWDTILEIIDQLDGKTWIENRVGVKVREKQDKEG